MKKLRQIIEGIRTFIGEVGVEMRKSTWPERSELMESTVVVIVSVLLLSTFVGFSDWILVRFLRLMIPAG
ncbi:MAG: preprotein translocase subunit SecE [Kiritimatiellia bacterium]